MNITHPCADTHKSTVIPADIRAYVDGLAPLPTHACPALRSPYWAGFQPAAVMPDGCVPAGTYTDPDTDAAVAAVEGLYLAIGRPVTRHMIAVALNFQDYRYVDAIRDRIAAAVEAAQDAGQPVTPPWTRKPGQRSFAYAGAQPVVADVIAAQAAAREVAKAS
jgi:hypothetical protein